MEELYASYFKKELKDLLETSSSNTKETKRKKLNILLNKYDSIILTSSYWVDQNTRLAAKSQKLEKIIKALKTDSITFEGFFIKISEVVFLKTEEIGDKCVYVFTMKNNTIIRLNKKGMEYIDEIFN